MDKDSKFELFNSQKENLFDEAFESVKKVEEEKRREAEARRREAEEREREEREYAKDVANDIGLLLSQVLERIKQSGIKEGKISVGQLNLNELKAYNIEYQINEKGLEVRLRVDFNIAEKQKIKWLGQERNLNERSLINILSRSGLRINFDRGYEMVAGYPELRITYDRYAKEEKDRDFGFRTSFSR